MKKSQKIKSENRFYLKVRIRERCGENEIKKQKKDRRQGIRWGKKRIKERE